MISGEPLKITGIRVIQGLKGIELIGLKFRDTVLEIGVIRGSEVIGVTA